MEASQPFGFNYVDVTQNTGAWKRIRNHKVTGSKLARVLGFYSSKKFTGSWDMVFNTSL